MLQKPCELIFIYILWFNMLYIRFIRIIWMYRAFSHLCNKMTTKINYALDHHEFVCQRIWINHPADSQTDSSLYKPSVQLSVCNKKTETVYTIVLALTLLDQLEWTCSSWSAWSWRVWRRCAGTMRSASSSLTMRQPLKTCCTNWQTWRS